MKNISLNEFARLNEEANRAIAVAEDLKRQRDNMTNDLLEGVLSVLRPGEGVTASQISQSIDGILDSNEIARRLCSYGGPKCTYQQERVPSYYRETDANGNILPNSPVRTQFRQVNVYRAVRN